MTELLIFFEFSVYIPATFSISEETKFLFLINIFKFLNFIKSRPINAAGNIPASDSTE